MPQLIDTKKKQTTVVSIGFLFATNPEGARAAIWGKIIRRFLVSASYSNRLSAFLAKKHGLWVDGKEYEASGQSRIDVLDPGTGKIISTIAAAVEADIDIAVKAARKALEEGPWGSLSPVERSRLLFRFSAMIEAHADELAEIEAVDAGKNLAYARCADMVLTSNTYHYMAGWATKITGESAPVVGHVDTLSYTVREPVGVAGLIVPWNFPMVLLAYKLAPALAAGCTVVIKPAENTSLSTLRLAEIAKESGIPDGVINVVTGYGAEAGTALVDHLDVDKIAFTGSTPVGRLIACAAARGNFKRVTLELGGKSPMIVLPDVDIEQLVAGIIRGIFFHQGQVCTAGSRLYLPESLHDRVLDALVPAVEAQVVGHGLSEGTTLGPLVSQTQLDRVMGYVDEARQQGARVVTGGYRVGSDGFFMAPTILVDVNATMSCVREEIFGPVLTVMRYPDRDLDSVCAAANATEFGLAASIWTRDLSLAHRLAKRLKAGNVWINTHNLFDPSLPFGGMKQSGWGREGGFEAIRMFTEVKSVCAAL